MSKQTRKIKSQTGKNSQLRDQIKDRMMRSKKFTYF